MRDEELAELMGAAEALLFVSDEPAPSAKLASILDVSPTRMDEVLVTLAAEYADENRGIQLREVAGGWRFVTHPAFHDAVERYVLSWDTRKLSAAALEALAVVAYHQPVTRAGINAIRGVSSEGVVSSLADKGLIREVGRDASAGGAVLYATTRSFLEHFGLKSIDELPPLEDFAPDEDSRAYIRERLSSAAARREGMAFDPTGADAEGDGEGGDFAGGCADGDGAGLFVSVEGFVEDVDFGNDERHDDASAMAEIIAESATDKVGEPGPADV